eukprot:CAMPEP_0185744238 /NCGR_PEP_ID=MMETSP1174-20130828/2275_1 /TAXON_ID=35687 /ORGANISM="Dictyocha speculum, Strain CCMP1381" /LENGTH=31 /DNA_ID= /DNA_START= /DNA_END= /DNA_ORIENTATION=
MSKPWAKLTTGSWPSRSPGGTAGGLSLQTSA